MARNSGRFRFDGGAATYLGTGILGFLITVFTLGFCYPFALVLTERWRAKHSYIDGQRLVFTGSAWGLFGNWVKWLLLQLHHPRHLLVLGRPAYRPLEVGAHGLRPDGAAQHAPGCYHRHVPTDDPHCFDAVAAQRSASWGPDLLTCGLFQHRGTCR